MTTATIALLALVAAAPSAADLQRRVVGAGVRVALLPGQAGELSEPLGVGMGVRIRVRPPAVPRSGFVGEVAVEHDRFGRSVRVQAELEDAQGLPSGERIELIRSQRTTLTRMMAGVGYAPAGRRVQGRVAVMGGAALAFFLHPGASPTSVSRWKALARADAGIALKVYRQLWIELSVEYNVLGPEDDEQFDFGKGETESVRPFGDYGGASVTALYAF